MDILIRGGHVIDPANGIDRVCDIAIRNGAILAVGSIPALENPEILDASGHYVVPGLVDMHTHIFQGGSQFGFNADLLLPYGITACVDAGTAGSANYEALHRILAQNQVRTYTFLNISPMGQMGSGLNENLDPALTDKAGIQRLIESYPGEIRGLKVRISRSIVGSYGSAPLKRALELGARFRLPVCVHCTDPCIPMAEFAAMLRPGDILCHLYHGKGSTILDDTGKVLPEVLNAAARGVVMDCANGRTNFSFDVAQKAIAQGFLPTVISTDLTAATVSKGRMVRNLPFLLSKYLNLGLSMPEVVSCATIAPAKALSLSDGTGTLSVGAQADVAILKLSEQRCEFLDSQGKSLTGNRMLTNQITVSRGSILFDANTLPHL